MSDTTYLQLPYLAASQAQKHVTHNEALSLLDSLVHLAVKSRALATPPATPAEADRYLVAAAPTGLWLDRANQIAIYLAGAWRFLTPREGWRMWIDDENLLLAFDGATWISSTVPTSLQNMQSIGINATADSTNKLSVNSSAILFNHAGAGTQIKVNKNSAANSASFLFQTGFSGRAEIGTTGDDDFHFKVSADGTTFAESFVLNAATGRADFKKSILLSPQVADPVAPSNGQLWYNSTTAKFRGRQDNANVDLASAAAGADASIGEAALALVPSALRGKKFAITDFVSGGFAARNNNSTLVLDALENRLTISNTSGGKSTSSKKAIVVNAPNALRYHHGDDGQPLGVLIEPAYSYLNKQSQPALAQYEGGVAGVSIVTGPNGYSGNWLEILDANSTRFAYRSVTVSGNTDYWFSFLVHVFGDTAPIVGTDFAIAMPETNMKNPVTGGLGYKIEGPFQSGVYRVSAFVTTNATPTYNVYGVQKNAGIHNNKRVIVGPMNFGQGRYPPSMFDNATATPNVRSADIINLPLDGFNFYNSTLFGEYTMPFGATNNVLMQLFANGSNRFHIYAAGSSLLFGQYNGVNEVWSFDNLTAGSNYKFAVAVDGASKRVRAKINAVALIDMPFTQSLSSAPTVLQVGIGDQANFSFNSSIRSIGIIDRAWTAAEITKWVEA